MMTIILGAIIYFIIGGIEVGIMTIIDDDAYDDAYELVFIGILWPISLPLLIGLTIIAFVCELVNIIAGFFIKNKKH